MGLFGKKKDFWDEVDDPEVEISEASGDIEEDYEDDYEDDEQGIVEEQDDGRFHPTKSPVLKTLSRIVLFISVVVLAVSGSIVYTYFSNGGTLDSEPNFYASTYFGEEYDESVKQLLKMVQAYDARGAVSETDEARENQKLINEYMEVGGNFSFVIYDERDNQVLSSSDDAVNRIESSYYFTRMDTTGNSFELNVGMKNDCLDTEAWKQALTSCSEGYTVYAAVDNEFSSTTDGFYANYREFKRMNSWFDTAKIAAIAAAVVFLLMLIFCIAATGKVKGYTGISLTWFDKIFTEIALLLIIAFGGGCGYGAYYIHTNMNTTMTPFIAGGLAVCAYIFIVRGYFSIVRRIKAGTFINNMLIYRIFDAIGHLPAVPRVLLIILVLAVLNGALILALFMLDGLMLMGIPVVYVFVPVIFVLENICFISWVIHKGNEEYAEDDEEDEEDEDTQEEENKTEIGHVSGDTKPVLEPVDDLTDAAKIAAAQIPEDGNDWEHMDLGAFVNQAIGDAEELVPEEETPDMSDRTVMLPKEEIESLLGTSSLVRDSATSFDFIQLNKDVRKLHRMVLKERGITVTLRAPEKPIVLEMNKEDMWKAISLIFDNLEQYAEPDSRVYAEMYTQNGKLIYIVKNAVKEEDFEAAKATANSKTELTGGLKIAKQIIEANHGKFVVAMDGNIFKTGILLDMVQEQQA